MKEFPPFARSLILKMNCAHCHHSISRIINDIPQPRWEGDSSMSSENHKEDDLSCSLCHGQYDIVIKNSILGGELWLYKKNPRREIVDYEINEYTPPRKATPSYPMIANSRNLRIIENTVFEYLNSKMKRGIIHPYSEPIGEGKYVQYDGLSIDGDEEIIYELKYMSSITDTVRLLNVVTRAILTIENFKRDGLPKRQLKLLVVVPDKNIKECYSRFCEENEMLKDHVEVFSLEEIR